MIDALRHIYTEVGTVQAPPQLWVTLLTAGIAVALVLPHPIWRVTRNLITIAHEGGHAVVARASGRRLNGIRLHSDTSGVTVSSGQPRGPGMIATTFAGYVAPSLLGAGIAGLAAAGRITATLWVSLIALGVMILLIRNIYGAALMLVTMLAVAGLIYTDSTLAQTLAVSLLGWFMLLAAPKPVVELQTKRRQGQAAGSDADQLAHLTGIHPTAWIAAFQAVNLSAIALTVFLLIRN